MPSTTEWPPANESHLRGRLAAYYQASRQEAEEGILVARGIESRQTAANLVILAAYRAAENYAALRALVPDRAMPDAPGAVTVAVTLVPREIRELAGLHDLFASEAEQDGLHDHAQRSRDRAVQLRAIVAGGGQ